jgi:hypothetical protein
MLLLHSPLTPRATRARAADPFAQAAPAAAVPPAAAGFLAASERGSPLLATAEADNLLKRYDQESMAAQRQAKSAAAKPIASSCELPPLRASCVSLSARASGVMLGICADDTEQGLAALKAWTAGLGLPRKLLHGLDENGVPKPLPGSVFIKYNSASGDAFVSGYDGEARGVLFTPALADGHFRQAGYLPLALF